MDFYFATVVRELNSHCGTRWNKWKANLTEHLFQYTLGNYSVIAAVLLLILTCIQAVCSIFLFIAF
ncbi:hypothetical protein GBA52_001091 [Prunus armeniaca]|nr:hypothetical protein GBA52_001091 [Prunus armeniaca]